MKPITLFKLGVAFTILSIIAIAISIAYGIKAGVSYLNIEKDMRNAVGDTIVLQKDTLIIIDYSVANDNFTLSNGTKVSSEFVTKQIAE